MPAACMPRLRFLISLIAGMALAIPCKLEAAVDLADHGKIEKVDFERHVMGLFGRFGCNAGSCHGSFQGRNGFRLSLFASDPEMDYRALTRELLGRRINVTDPDSSLLLLKATGAVDHGGGRRFARGSWPYQIMHEWIASGGVWTKDKGAVDELTILPKELGFHEPGEKTAIKVVARFKDGTEEDVTPFCEFRINDDAVADINAAAVVHARRPGDTAIIVSYRGRIKSGRILIPFKAAPGFQFPDVKPENFIDQEVFARLKQLNILPSEQANDAEFLRRVTIDTIGSLPEPDEVRKFLENKDPQKRALKIDELLAHPLHAALWATKFCDITGNNTADLEGNGNFQVKLSQMWHGWFRKRIAENHPYDEIVHGVICATSRDGQSGEEWIKQFKDLEQVSQKGFQNSYSDHASLDLFWRKRGNVPLEQWGEKVAAAFLGVRLECAQCHKHPFDKWSQADYRAFANIFGQVNVGAAPDIRKTVESENTTRKKPEKGKPQLTPLREVYIEENKVRTLPDPATNKPLVPRTLTGLAVPIHKGTDARVKLFDWMRAPDNPYFARSFVNRVWGHYFGVGLVDPVDDFSQANMASNEKLLDSLAKDFIDHKFDIRRLERQILVSRTYQLSSVPNAVNRLDRRDFSHSYVRPLMAEVVLDVLNSALGVTEDFGADAPPNSKAIEVGSSRVGNGSIAYLFRTFGRPPRTSACDCERAMEPALPQKLFLMTDPALQAKFKSPKGRLQTLLKGRRSDKVIFEELVLATLSRPPTEEEWMKFTEYCSGEYKLGKKKPEEIYPGVLWALINTREFILNH